MSYPDVLEDMENIKILWHRPRIFLHPLFKIAFNFDFSVLVTLDKICAQKVKCNCLKWQILHL